MDHEHNVTQTSSHPQPHLIPAKIPEPPDHSYRDNGGDKVHTQLDQNAAFVAGVVAGVVAGIVILTVIIVLSLQYWRKRKSNSKNETEKKPKKEVPAASMWGRGTVMGNPQRSSPCVSECGRPIPTVPRQANQREVKDRLCYDQLAQAVELSLNPGAIWTFASPIYACPEHGAKGLFELEFRIWATGKKLLLCHNPLSDLEEPQWEFMRDVHVAIDELRMVYRVTVSSLCQYCVVAYGGEFREKLIVLPFVRPAPDNSRIITCTLFFERDPRSNTELDALVQQYSLPVNSGQNAVLCTPTLPVTVTSSKLHVKCNVPETLTSCLQITRPDGEKVLTVEQLKELHEEHRIGPCLQFVMELNDYPRPDRWPILKLSFRDCENKEVRTPETIFCPAFPSSYVSHVSLQQPNQGTVLSSVVKPVYRCNPGMFHKLWRNIAESPAWQYTLDDIARVEADAAGLRRNAGEQLLHDLAENHQDVTVERLAAVVQCMGYAPLRDDIRQGTMSAGWQFDDGLYLQLVDVETQLISSVYPHRSDTSISCGPVPGSPPQSTIHGGCCPPLNAGSQILVHGEPPPTIQWHPSESSEEMELLPLSSRNTPALVDSAASPNEVPYTGSSYSSSRFDVCLQLQLSLGVFSIDDDELPNTFP